MVKLTKDFYGVADGEIYPQLFKAGEEVEGDLAKVAVANGFAGKKSKKDEPAANSDSSNEPNDTSTSDDANGESGKSGDEVEDSQTDGEQPPEDLLSTAK